MSQVINTNVMSLNAQRNLATSSDEMSTSLQRLSSGMRINGAKDDAAGLAISQRFTAQIRGLSTAIRNAGDAVSLTQTAEGALGSVTSNLQRMRELAVQASNGTNSQADRDALNAEYLQLQSEVQRIADQTVFAGTKLLDGSFNGVAFQVGANVGEVISISSLADVNTNALGGNYTRIEASVAVTSLTTNAAISAGGVIINGVDIGAIATGTGATRAQQLVTAINAVSARSGVGASIDGGNLVLTSASNIVITGATTDATAAGWANSTLNTSVATGAVGKTNLQSYTNAQLALGMLDSALTAVNSARATIGSINSRFDSVIANLRSTTENLSASRSRIQDTDFAQETARLTRAQVLQQAGVAMLAQANAAPQQVLSLLRG